jgi:hypothetical protein
MRKSLYLLLAIIGLPFAIPLAAICYLQDLLRKKDYGQFDLQGHKKRMKETIDGNIIK